MREITVTIDSVINQCKPTDDVWAITQRLTRQSGTVEELAGELVLPNGRTWCPGVYRVDGVRRNDEWVQQEVFALDADSKNGVLTSGDIIDRCRHYGILPAFIHTSFSHTDETPKYRVVFVSPVVITEPRVRDVIQRALLRLFPEFDQSTKDAARMFFGGKEIVYRDFDATLDILGLFRAVAEKITDEDPTHSKRNIQGWCQSVGLHLYNGLPAVLEYENVEDAKVGENVASSISIILKMPQNRQVLQFRFSPETRVTRSGNTKYGKVQNVEASYELVRGVDFDALYHRCEVYRDFMDGVDVHHDVTWAIATNLVRIKGGETRFFEGLQRRKEYDVDKWRSSIAYIKKMCYLPVRYDNAKIADYYPNAAQVAQAHNILSAAKTKKGEYNTLPGIVISSEEAYTMLHEQATKALEREENDITVFRFDTGVGKSTFIRSIDRPFLLAVPTHDLKDQVVKDFAKEGKEVAFTPRFPEDVDEGIYDAVDKLYSLGAGSSASAYVRDLAKKHPTIAEYISQLQEALKTQGTLVTTHARLPYLKVHHDLIVIDEDYLQTEFTQSSVSFVALAKVRDLMQPRRSGFGSKVQPFRDSSGHIIDLNDDLELLNGLINRVMDSPQHIAHTTGNLPFKHFKFIEKLVVENRKTISGNVLGFFRSSHYVRIGENLFFITRRELPKNKKIFIFSATANEKLYKLAYGDRVRFVDSPDVALKGKVIQYPVNSSRNAMKTRNVINFAKTVIGDKNVITFKDHSNDFANVVATIGAVAGMNNLEGKDLAVIATPHVNPVVYLLLASALGHVVGVDDLSEMRTEKLNRNGFEFYFYCYVNELMREIQLHTIESELYQAVGRARAVHHNVEVVVISAYPVKQASIVKLTPAQQQLLNATVSEEELL